MTCAAAGMVADHRDSPGATVHCPRFPSANTCYTHRSRSTTDQYVPSTGIDAGTIAAAGSKIDPSEAAGRRCKTRRQRRSTTQRDGATPSGLTGRSIRRIQGDRITELNVACTTGIRIAPECQRAVIGLKCFRCGGDDIATGLGQNRRARSRAGQVGIEVDIATVNVDRPGNAGGAADGDVGCVAALAQREAANAAAQG